MPRAINITIKETKNKLPDLEKALKLLTEKDVLVGVPEDKSNRKDPGAINNAALAYIHDTGSPAQNIPPRPFFEPGIGDVKPRLIARMKALAKALLERKTIDVDKALNALGLIAAGGVKNRINEGPFTPLSERTLAQRRARGRTGEKPLIDTGQLRNAINYILRKRS